ncbi:methyltransferase domain-containing protein [Micromonospora sp. NPDC047793]|uniref:SAM-dependent methyltransferase n=1 Tax=unclassified Micromonospora TaxID=2617518 RepID=UPI001034868C|nr:methyltransferase domain-containing protein [Verrucosispora sp. SN26_14.1]TBL45471.1 class I SAM-dependent methyltransferase [Verrucosispora sp. SN26_14.1]
MSVEQHLRAQVNQFLAPATDEAGDAAADDRPEGFPYEPPTPARVAEFFDRYNSMICGFFGGNMHQGYWDGPSDTSSMLKASNRMTDVFIDRLAGIGPGARILDLGCGTGRPAVRIARRTGAEVVGISISGRDVELAQAYAAGEDDAENVTFQQANALDLPFEPGSFDAIVAIDSFAYFADRGELLARISPLLKPGGRIVLTDDVARGPELTGQDEQDTLFMLACWRQAPLARAEDYSGFAVAAGLELVEVTDITENTKNTLAHAYPLIRERTDLWFELDTIIKESTPADWEVEENPTDGVVLVVANRPA